MTTNTNTTDPMQRVADAAVTMIAGMIEARVEYAAKHGFEPTDEEIVASIVASLKRMMTK